MRAIYFSKYYLLLLLFLSKKYFYFVLPALLPEISVQQLSISLVLTSSLVSSAFLLRRGGEEGERGRDSVSLATGRAAAVHGRSDSHERTGWNKGATMRITRQRDPEEGRIQKDRTSIECLDKTSRLIGCDASKEEEEGETGWASPCDPPPLLLSVDAFVSIKSAYPFFHGCMLHARAHGEKKKNQSPMHRD